MGAEVGTGPGTEKGEAIRETASLARETKQVSQLAEGGVAAESGCWSAGC
jgi:hypothetical protein